MNAEEFNLHGSDLMIDPRFGYRLRKEALRRSDLVGLTGRTILILGSILITFASAAQTSGNLQLQIDPAINFTYKLDHQFTMQQPDLELLEGAHHFSFWAPQRRIVDTTITMVGGADRTFVLRLPFSPEYLVYQRDMNAYRKQMRLQRVIPAAVTGASLIYTAVKYGQVKKAHDQLNDDRNAYDEATSPNVITVLKDETIPSHADDFDKARTGYEVAAGVTVLFAAATAYLYLRSAKTKKPVFIDTEKVRFDGLSWMPGANGGAWSGGLTWNFSR